MIKVEEIGVKHAMAAAACATALVASLAACGGGDTATPPGRTGSASANSLPPTTPTPTTATATATATGPVALAARSTYTYGDLLVVVNLPADIPSASRSSLRLFSSFLQARGRTTAQNRLDPSLSGLASAEVVKYLRTTSVPESVQGIGSVIYTISKVERGSSGNALILGCLDQSKLVQVRKDGSRFVAGAKKYPILKMTANISPGRKGPEVTLFTFAVGTC